MEKLFCRFFQKRQNRGPLYSVIVTQNTKFHLYFERYYGYSINYVKKKKFILYFYYIGV